MPDISISPLVSIVIPAYNQAQYLADALDSALAQTYGDYEVIVVDDGSTDATSEVVRRYREHPEYGARVHYLWQVNQGLAGARNTGIRAARGEWVGLLDSDDQWLPDYLEKMLALVDAHPEADVFYCPVIYIDTENRVLPQVAPAFGVPPEALYHRLLRANHLVPSTILMRRSVVAAAGMFDPAFRRLQDWELWLRLLQSGTRFIEHPERLVRYRLHGSSLSMDPRGGQQAVSAMVEKLFGPDDGRHLEWPADKRRAYGGKYRYFALSSVQYSRDWAAGAGYLRQALLVDGTLADDLDLFYELALGAQPIGYRGVSEAPEGSAGGSLEAALKQVFQPPLPARLAALRSQAAGTAFFALGLAAYHRRDLAEARLALLKAARLRPGLLRRPKLLGPLLKSMLGETLLERLRRLRGRSQESSPVV